jgi:hypothetical protein
MSNCIRNCLDLAIGLLQQPDSPRRWNGRAALLGSSLLCACALLAPTGAGPSRWASGGSQHFASLPSVTKASDSPRWWMSFLSELGLTLSV